MQVGMVSSSPTTISTRDASNKTATLIDTGGFTLQQDLTLSTDGSRIELKSKEDYQNQLRIQGKQEQSLTL